MSVLIRQLVSSVVGVDGWLERAGNEVSVAVGQTFPVLQLVCAGGKSLQPTLDVGVVLAYFGDIFKRLEVRADGEFGRPMVTV